MNSSHDLHQAVPIFRFRQKSGLNALYGKDLNRVLRSLLTNRVNLPHVCRPVFHAPWMAERSVLCEGVAAGRPHLWAPNLMHLLIHTIALQEGVRL